LGKAVASDHQHTRLLVEQGKHYKLGEVPLVPQPVRFSGRSSKHIQHVPMLGEHNEVVLTKMLGKTKEEIETLHQQGVI